MQMHNLVCLIGRLTQDVNLEKEGGKDIARPTLAVQRTFKNEDGVFETDYIDIVLYNTLATHTSEYCKKGDLVGIKGRLENTQMASGSILEVLVDKITFLASNANKIDK